MPIAEDLKIEYLGGMFPNQAWGYWKNIPFYFRARHGAWYLYIGKEGQTADSVTTMEPATLFGHDYHAGGWENEQIEEFLEKAIALWLIKEDCKRRGEKDE